MTSGEWLEVRGIRRNGDRVFRFASKELFRTGAARAHNEDNDKISTRVRRSCQVFIRVKKNRPRREVHIGSIVPNISPLWSAAACRRCIAGEACLACGENPAIRAVITSTPRPASTVSHAPQSQHVPASRDGLQRRQAAALHMSCAGRDAGDEWRQIAKFVCRVRRGGPLRRQTFSCV